VSEASGAYLSAEDRARVHIDEKLRASGWVVQDANHVNLAAGRGVAVREFVLRPPHGRADYLLFVDRRPVGAIEAKPEGDTLTEVELQTSRYTDGLPDGVEPQVLPLPFRYESTGIETRFTNAGEPIPRSRRVFDGYFHRPETLAAWIEQVAATLEAGTFRTRIDRLPPIDDSNLWSAQHEAVHNLEASLRANRQRALIQMATGSGKTYTAATLAYRLIEFADAKRILFLVDRSNLGRQARGEFQRFDIPGTSRKFTEVFNIQHVLGGSLDPVSRVCISTVQRMYSILKGEILDDELDAHSLDELQVKETVPVVYNPAIPPETFDVVIIDECHRSIFGLWRQVVEYFDAFLIGLTATPNKQALGFFDQNLVMEYPHERAVVDGVNVDYRIYRIRTEITEAGSTIDAGLMVEFRNRQSRKPRWEVLDDAVAYPATDLDRKVVAKDQIRTVIRTFRERLFTEIFPGRKAVPKTLIFAKDDSHADDIVDIVRDEFGKGNDFCQKITYRTYGKDPEQLLQAFRNSPELRVVVTVDMIATGTDVKPLECLLFMRDVKSRTYYQQMLGRGVRIINDTDFQSVTTDALSKEGFVVVDAIGVTARERFLDVTQPLDRKPTVPLDKLLKLVSFGSTDADLASTVASRLARLDRQLTKEDRQRLRDVAGGIDIGEVTRRLVDSVDPDHQREAAIAATGHGEPTEAAVASAAQRLVAEALEPLAANSELRQLILDVWRSYEQTIDETSKDVLLEAGHSAEAREGARALVTSFRHFLEQHQADIRALQVLYSRPYKERLTYSDIKGLAHSLSRPPRAWTPERLWQAYNTLDHSKVRGSGQRMLTDVVSLVQFALEQENELVPFQERVEARFTAWLEMQEQAGTRFTEEQGRWLEWMKDHIAASMTIDASAFELAPFTAHGGLGRACEVFGDRLTPLMGELSNVLAA
jgi:type I restriction enzyme R subunit